DRYVAIIEGACARVRTLMHLEATHGTVPGMGPKALTLVRNGDHCASCLSYEGIGACRGVEQERQSTQSGSGPEPAGRRVKRSKWQRGQGPRSGRRKESCMLAGSETHLG
ncbi:hypothetical protein Vretifemale_18820, partial [Volvox reticuliferus]